MKKNLIILVVAFAAGFLTHAFFFPDILSNGITDIGQIVLPNPTSTQTKSVTSDPLITTIYFDGERFSRTNVTIGFTRYIQIINNSKNKLMWLISNEPSLTTPRGYGYTEAIEKQFNKKGQYIIENKNNPQARLVITVK